MKSLFRLLAYVLVALGAMHPAQAHASFMADIIGQAVAGSMSTAPCYEIADEDERIEARAPSIAAMVEYFRMAMSGEDIAPAFKLNRRTELTIGDRSVGMAELNTLDDPLAVAGNLLEPQPLRDVRAGDHQTATGQWLVKSSGGEIAGAYDALFERQQGTWKIKTLAVLLPDDELVPSRKYCTDPGDAEDAELKAAEARLEYAETDLAKRQEKLARAQAMAAGSEKSLASDPDKPSRKSRAARDRARAVAAADQLAKAQADLLAARTGLDDARKELADYRSMIGPVRLSERLRIEAQRID